jgi:hypothetical protein
LARISGDRNYSAREKRLVAEKRAAEARANAFKADVKVRDARIVELRERMDELKERLERA